MVCPFPECCLTQGLLLKFPSTVRKPPTPLSLVARTRIQHSQPSSPAGRQAPVKELNIFPPHPATILLPLLLLGPQPDCLCTHWMWSQQCSCQLGARAAVTPGGTIPDPKQHQLSPPPSTGTQRNRVFLLCVFWLPLPHWSAHSQPWDSGRQPGHVCSASPSANWHPSEDKLQALLGSSKEAAALQRAGGAPGSLPAGLWGAGSTLPCSASSHGTGAQQSSLGSPSCKQGRRKTSPHKAERSAWTHWASIGTHAAGSLSYQTSSLERARTALPGSLCTLNTDRPDVKAVLLALEEPGPFPGYFSRNLFTGFRKD